MAMQSGKRHQPTASASGGKQLGNLVEPEELKVALGAVAARHVHCHWRCWGRSGHPPGAANLLPRLALGWAIPAGDPVGPHDGTEDERLRRDPPRGFTRTAGQITQH
jgi:hypothetical protein